ncbi:thiamine diphosphokinase [uncultured Shimia sp.]|uniref:thiamine diphosphokinase n=1 Tax=uncultured Shimia sp. TaxID=573152 RepID=UPI00263659F3|nr:thiamine diphosphokinase [uncultured Shimia sp.]
MGIVHELEPITLIGGGLVHNDDLSACLDLAPHLVAADGGALTALDLGHMPKAVIGDMDSSPDLVARGVPAAAIHQIAEQDSTDFDKALRNISAPLVLGVGFTGKRVDHELACYNALLRHADRRCILIGSDDVICLCPPSLPLDLEAGTRVSLFPLATVTGRSKGLQWPLDGSEFAPSGMIATSNCATGAVQLDLAEPGMLVILPKACLEILVKALLAQPGSWSAL